MNRTQSELVLGGFALPSTNYTSSALLVVMPGCDSFLDYESGKVGFSVGLLATDSAQHVLQTQVHLLVTDVDEPPTLESSQVFEVVYSDLETPGPSNLLDASAIQVSDPESEPVRLSLAPGVSGTANVFIPGSEQAVAFPSLEAATLFGTFGLVMNSTANHAGSLLRTGRLDMGLTTSQREQLDGTVVAGFTLNVVAIDTNGL